MIAQSSRTAYSDLKELPSNNLYDRQDAVYRCLKRYPGMSSNEVARTLTRVNIQNEVKWVVSSKDVCSRMNELLTDGRVRISGSKTDRKTGRTVRSYEVVE